MDSTIEYFTGNIDEDNEIMTMILNEIDFLSGTVRRNMYKQKRGTGGSMLFGLTWKKYLSKTQNRSQSKYKGLFQTKVMDEYPDLDIIFKQYRDKYFPKFEYTQVQMNRNFLAPAHFDSDNTGMSVVCAFGDYSGGLLSVDFAGNIKSYDLLNNGYVQFDGSKYKHWVEPFKGERYSLVFFDNLKHRKLTPYVSEGDKWLEVGQKGINWCTHLANQKKL